MNIIKGFLPPVVRCCEHEVMEAPACVSVSQGSTIVLCTSRFVHSMPSLFGGVPFPWPLKTPTKGSGVDKLVQGINCEHQEITWIKIPHLLHLPPQAVELMRVSTQPLRRCIGLWSQHLCRPRSWRAMPMGSLEEQCQSCVPKVLDFKLASEARYVQKGGT